VSESDLFLIGAAFLTATLSGILGMGGGILLFTIMGQSFPLSILIPFHGIIQLASNLSRTALNHKETDYRIVGQFSLGAIFGAGIGSQFIVQIPDHYYKIGVGLFILGITFMPNLKKIPRLPYKWAWVGGSATFLSLFVGATGPLIAPFYLQENLNKETLVATKAGCQVTLHSLKVATYFLLGFGLGHLVPLLAAMIGVSIIGSYCGKLILGKVPEKPFRWVYIGLITVLAIRMIFGGIKEL
jgi:uncharacterized membrane protein YfcA